MSARTDEASHPPAPLSTWDVLRTPMTRLLRGRLGPAPHPVTRPPRGAWRSVVRESALPIQLRDLVERVVRRTRLWRSEKLDVAMELVAHFRDGLGAGRSADELSASFGDPEQAARLLRRAAKRKRPFWWRVTMYARRGVLTMIAGLIGVYLILFLRYHTGEVVVSHDYLRDMNARALAAREDDRAWPLYKRAIAQLKHDGPVQPSEEIKQFGIDRIGPDDPLYPDAIDYLARARNALDLTREAAKKPALGLEVGLDTEVEFFGVSLPDVRSDARPLDQSLIGVLLPHLGEFRSLARLLRFEAQLAARSSDAHRVADNVRTILAMGRHVREHPVIINDMVAIALSAVACEVTTRTLTDQPDLLSREQLLDLAHAFASWDEGFPLVQVRGERAMFEDFLQRVFTDDGNGDGFITAEGMRAMSDLNDSFTLMHDQSLSAQLVSGAMGPVSSVVIASRKEQLRAYDRFMALVDAALATDPWALDEPIASLHLLEAELDIPRYLPVGYLMPACTRAISSARQGEAARYAALVAIALELFRREHGSYPTTLADLSPRFLPSVPRDPFDGQPLRYEVREGVAHVWSIGVDRKDDAGRLTEKGPWNGTVYSWRPLESVQQTLADPKARGSIDGDWLMLPAPAWQFTRSDQDANFMQWKADRESLEAFKRGE